MLLYYAVQVEARILFHCHCLRALSELFVCSLRKKYSFLFLPFCHSSYVEAPYDALHSKMDSVFDFLSQRLSKLCYCISDSMVYLMAGKYQPQTNQPNVQAGGYP